MARTLTKTRKDSHGYSLRPGEYQRSEGRYEYNYNLGQKVFTWAEVWKQHFVWKEDS